MTPQQMVNRWKRSSVVLGTVVAALTVLILLGQLGVPVPRPAWSTDLEKLKIQVEGSIQILELEVAAASCTAKGALVVVLSQEVDRIRDDLSTLRIRLRREPDNSDLQLRIGDKEGQLHTARRELKRNLGRMEGC